MEQQVATCETVHVAHLPVAESSARWLSQLPGIRNQAWPHRPRRPGLRVSPAPVTTLPRVGAQLRAPREGAWASEPWCPMAAGKGHPVVPPQGSQQGADPPASQTPPSYPAATEAPPSPLLRASGWRLQAPPTARPEVTQRCPGWEEAALETVLEFLHHRQKPGLGGKLHLRGPQRSRPIPRRNGQPSEEVLSWLGGGSRWQRHSMTFHTGHGQPGPGTWAARAPPGTVLTGFSGCW